MRGLIFTYEYMYYLEFTTWDRLMVRTAQLEKKRGWIDDCGAQSFAYQQKIAGRSRFLRHLLSII
jgi:hypothetical protein